MNKVFVLFKKNYYYYLLLLLLLLLLLFCVSIYHRLTLKDLALRCSDYYSGQTTAFSSKNISISLPLLMPSHCLWVLSLELQMSRPSPLPLSCDFLPEQLSSKSVILLLSVVLSLSTILASTLFALSSAWSPRDCFRTSQGRVGEWETKKRDVLSKPRWRPVHVLRFATIFLKSRDRSQSKR